MVSLFYLVTAISTSIGAFVLVVGLAAATGAPQEAAVAALAIAMAVIPYVFTRCIQISLDRTAQLSALKDIRAALLNKV